MMPRRTGLVPRSGWLATAVCALAMVVGGAAGLDAQPLRLTAAGSIAGPIDLVEASGGYAYLTRGATLTVYEIADPAAPVRRGAHTFPEQIWGLTVVESTAYVVAGHSGLFVLDVTDPDRPAVRGTLETPGQAKNVAVSGRRGVVADHMSGIDVIDLTDPTAPVSLGSVFTDGYARDVAMAGAYAYGVDNPSGFYVLDLERPDPLEPVGMTQSAPTPRFVEVLDTDPGVAVLVGGRPYDPFRTLRSEPVDEPEAGALHLFDVSDPAAPVALASFSTPGTAQRVSVRGGLAYVADGDAGLSVVDLSAPADPRLAATYATDRPARDVALADTAVLVLIGVTRRGAHTQDDGDVVVLRMER